MFAYRARRAGPKSNFSIRSWTASTLLALAVLAASPEIEGIVLDAGKAVALGMQKFHFEYVAEVLPVAVDNCRWEWVVLWCYCEFVAHRCSD
jgi:hypothetical protein